MAQGIAGSSGILCALLWIARIDNPLWGDDPDRAALLGLTQITAFLRAYVDHIFGLGSADVTILA